MKYLTGTAALALMCFCSTQAFAKDSDGVKVDEKGITIGGGDFELNIGGRLHVDGVVFDDPATGQSNVTDVDARRARIEVSGKIAGLLRFSVGREFAGDSKGWRNVWASIEPMDNVELRGGNFIVPFNMEDMQSSNSIPFVERSLASTLTPGYGVGGAVTANGKNWSASVGYFTDPLDNDNGRSPERGKGVSGRATFAPVNSGGNLLHFAIAGEKRNFSATETLRFSGDAGSALAPTLMSTGALADLDGLTAYNAEIGGSFGAFQILGLSTWTDINRNTLSDLSFSGQTLQAAWLLTGGRYRYAEKGGVIGGPDFGRKDSGIEVAARYSRLDLDDAAVQRGKGRALSLGANWYINRNFRVMAGYTNSKVNFSSGAASLKNDVGVARFQVNF